MSSDIMAQLMNRDAQAMGFGMGGYAFNRADEALQSQLLQEATANQAETERKRALTAQTQMQTDILGKDEAAYGEARRQAEKAKLGYETEDITSGRKLSRQQQTDMIQQFQAEAAKRLNDMQKMADAAIVARKKLAANPMMANQESWAGVIRPQLEAAGYTDLPMIYSPDILPLLDKDIQDLTDRIHNIDKVRREVEIKQKADMERVAAEAKSREKVANIGATATMEAAKERSRSALELLEKGNAGKLAVQNAKNAGLLDVAREKFKNQNVAAQYANYAAIAKTGTITEDGKTRKATDAEMSHAAIMASAMANFVTLNKQLTAEQEAAMWNSVMSGGDVPMMTPPGQVTPNPAAMSGVGAPTSAPTGVMPTPQPQATTSGIGSRSVSGQISKGTPMPKEEAYQRLASEPTPARIAGYIKLYGEDPTPRLKAEGKL